MSNLTDLNLQLQDLNPVSGIIVTIYKFRSKIFGIFS